MVEEPRREGERQVSGQIEVQWGLRQSKNLDQESILGSSSKNVVHFLQYPSYFASFLIFLSIQTISALAVFMQGLCFMILCFPAIQSRLFSRVIIITTIKITVTSNKNSNHHLLSTSSVPAAAKVLYIHISLILRG